MLKQGHTSPRGGGLSRVWFLPMVGVRAVCVGGVGGVGGGVLG